MTDTQITIEVAYAPHNEQVLIPLKIAKGTCIEHAIQASNLLMRFPDIDLKKTKVGIFGTIYPLNKVLIEGDRVEIYRPLRCDPKQARRDRVK
ncbi:MAG: RnfH family protein [Methylococcales bacterium]|nr:RnfH family protein [Methylococcales bacterium]